MIENLSHAFQAHHTWWFSFWSFCFLRIRRSLWSVQSPWLSLEVLRIFRTCVAGYYFFLIKLISYRCWIVPEIKKCLGCRSSCISLVDFKESKINKVGHLSLEFWVSKFAKTSFTTSFFFHFFNWLLVFIYIVLFFIYVGLCSHPTFILIF